MTEAVISPNPIHSLEKKIVRLEKFINSFGRIIVAYSGGVDSSFLAHKVHELKGKQNSLIITTNSPSVSQKELKLAMHLARNRKWNHKIVMTNEFQNIEYRKNNYIRCYHCKFALYERLHEIAEQEKFDAIFNGVNFDDLADYRPGIKAAEEKRVISPLVVCKITKKEIRLLSRNAGLKNWDKPAQPCLSSRIPYGTEITMEMLSQVEKAENLLSKLGFTEFRVRNHGNVARIEIHTREFKKMMKTKIREEIYSNFSKFGFEYISLDLMGFQSGSLNRSIKK